MYKRLGIVALVLALALVVAVPAAQARGAPYGMFRGSVWVEFSHADPPLDGELPAELDLHHLVFNAREGRGNQSADGHLFLQRKGSATFDHRVDIFAVQTTGPSPCSRLLLGDPEDPHGLCAMAMGSYSGPIDDAPILATVVCKETQYGGEDTIALLLLDVVDGYLVPVYPEFVFKLVGGDVSIQLPTGGFWGDVGVAAWADVPDGFDHMQFDAREGRGNQPGTGYFFATDGDTEHWVELDDVRTSGATPTGLPLGVYVDGWGVCAFASGHYSGPIEDANFVCMLVCKETPFAVDTILLIASVDRTDFETPPLGVYFFGVVDGNFVIN